MKKRFRWLPPVLFAGSILGLWEASVTVLDVSPIILPPFSAVLAAMVAEVPLYLRHSLVTGTEVAGGFLAAMLIGVLCGAVIALSPLMGSAIYPSLIAAQVMPKVAIAPLLIVWLGFEIAPKLVLTALIAFFPIVINTVVGLNMTSREGVYLFRSMGAGSFQTFFKLRLPNALPVFFGGLKVAATLAVIGAVVAEFTGASAGLGFLITVQVGNAETAGAFASIIYLTLMGLLVFLFVILIERLVVPKHMLRRFDDPATQRAS